MQVEIPSREPKVALRSCSTRNNRGKPQACLYVTTCSCRKNKQNKSVCNYGVRSSKATPVAWSLRSVPFKPVQNMDQHPPIVQAKSYVSPFWKFLESTGSGRYFEGDGETTLSFLEHAFQKKDRSPKNGPTKKMGTHIKAYN